MYLSITTSITLMQCWYFPKSEHVENSSSKCKSLL